MIQCLLSLNTDFRPLALTLMSAMLTVSSRGRCRCIKLTVQTPAGGRVPVLCLFFCGGRSDLLTPCLYKCKQVNIKLLLFFIYLCYYRFCGDTAGGFFSLKITFTGELDQINIQLFKPKITLIV